MKLSNTVEMMNSENYIDRFRAEYFQLNIRINGLSKMLQGYKEGTLSFKPSCSYELLHTQLVYMKNYREALERRAKIENISIWCEA